MKSLVSLQPHSYDSDNFAILLSGTTIFNAATRSASQLENRTSQLPFLNHILVNCHFKLTLTNAGFVRQFKPFRRRRVDWGGGYGGT